MTGLSQYTDTHGRIALFLSATLQRAEGKAAPCLIYQMSGTTHQVAVGDRVSPACGAAEVRLKMLLPEHDLWLERCWAVQMERNWCNRKLWKQGRYKGELRRRGSWPALQPQPAKLLFLAQRILHGLACWVTVMHAEEMALYPLKTNHY